MRSATLTDSPPRAAWQWQATGTIWRIHHDGCVDATLAVAVRDAVERDEARWSRFRRESEVARISAAAGSDVPVTAETIELLAAALTLQERTGGVFNPLVGGILGEWGYASGIQHRSPYTAKSPRARPLEGSVELDEARWTVRIPAGCSLDLGGIGKGWIADRTASLLRAERPQGEIVINAGGDLVAAGGVHLIAVDGNPRVWLPLAGRQGIATSGWDRRSWTNGDGRRSHHLIDPFTGRPGEPATATVLAEDGATADVLAKTLALRPALLDGLATPARVETGGTIHANPAWRRLAASDPQR